MGTTASGKTVFMQNMQKEMMKSQEELEGKIFEVTTGGGMIKLEMKIIIKSLILIIQALKNGSK